MGQRAEREREREPGQASALRRVQVRKPVPEVPGLRAARALLQERSRARVLAQSGPGQHWGRQR